MDLLIIAGITVFFGIAALSAAAQRNAPATREVILVRADQLREKDGEHGDAGFGIFLLILVVVGAIAFL